jgi:hypothetical protein
LSNIIIGSKVNFRDVLQIHIDTTIEVEMGRYQHNADNDGTMGGFTLDDRGFQTLIGFFAPISLYLNERIGF